VENLRFHAEWKRLGRGAGPVRNGRMLSEGKPHEVIAFKGGKGTCNMVDQAAKAGVSVRTIGWTYRLPPLPRERE
jgi:hypothetical protein